MRYLATLSDKSTCVINRSGNSQKYGISNLGLCSVRADRNFSESKKPGTDSYPPQAKSSYIRLFVKSTYWYVVANGRPLYSNERPSGAVRVSWLPLTLSLVVAPRTAK